MLVTSKRQLNNSSAAPSIAKESVGGTLLALFACASALACILMAVWSLNRRLDLVQEGMYLLEYVDFHPSLPYTPYLKLIPQLVPLQIVHYRLLNIFAIFLQSTVLAIGFWTWVCDRGVAGRSYSRLLLYWSLMILGSCLTYTLFPQTIGYNGNSIVLIDCAAGLLLLSLSSNSWKFACIAFLSGCAACLSVFPIFSSCLLYIAVSSMLCLLWKRSCWRQLGLFFAGLVCCAVSCYYFLDGVRAWIEQFPRLTSALMHGTHGTNLFAYTVTSMQKHQVELLALPLIGTCAFFLTRYLRNMQSNETRSQRIMIAVVSLALLEGLLVTLHAHLKFHSSLLYVPVVSVVGLLLLLPKRQVFVDFDRFELTNVAFGVVLLASLPFITSFGTSCPLFWHMFGNFGAIFLALAYASEYLAATTSCRALLAVVCVPCCILATLQFYDGFAKFSSPSYCSATIETPARLSGLIVEPDIKEFLECSEQTLLRNGFKKGDNLLVLSEIPILVYAMEAKSPCTPYYSIDPNEEGTIVAALTRLRQELDGKRHLFLVVCRFGDSPEPPPKVRAALMNAGLDFPRDFHMIGKAHVPQIGCGMRPISYFYKCDQHAVSIVAK